LLEPTKIQYAFFREVKMKYIGMFINLAMGDQELAGPNGRIQEFTNGVNETITDSWKISASVYGEGEYQNYQSLAYSLVASTPKPDLLFASCGQSLRALQIALAQDKTTPIVYSGVADPTNMDVIMPGYNVHGVTSYKLPKVLDGLKRLMNASHNIQKLRVIYDPKTRLGPAQLGGLVAGAGLLSPPPPWHHNITEVQGFSNRDPNLETLIRGFANSERGNGGLFVTTATYTAVHRSMLISIVNKAEDDYPGFRAIFPNRLYFRSGARLTYGAITPKLYRRAGRIAGTILNGMAGSDEVNTTDFEPPMT
jgi:hypothetical protein